MKIVIAGGSGQVGQVLVPHFRRAGDDIVLLGRDTSSLARTEIWDAQTLGSWTKELDGADVLINLAGRSVNCRYNADNRRIIKESRVDSTRVLGEAVFSSKTPPRIWLQASTATIYRHRYDAPNDERTGELGGDEPGAPDTWNFSIDVAKSWEKAFNEIQLASTRKVLMRSAILMSPNRGGAFDILLSLVRHGVGGRDADGRQFVSWIHDRDMARSVQFLIDREELSGPINLSSPNPLPNENFMRALRDAWGAKIGIGAPAWLLEIATFFMRTETELVLKSRRVVPTLLLRAGFSFDFPTWPEAARDLVSRWRILAK